MTRRSAVRNLMGVGLIWGLLWIVLALIAGAFVAFIDPADIDPGEEPIVLAPIIGMVGFLCGVAFGFLSTAGKPGPMMTRSLQVIVSGVLVAAAVPFLTGKILPEVLIMIPVGVLSAIVSVAIAPKWVSIRAA